MHPIIWLITSVIDLFMLAILIWVVLEMLLYFKIVNRTHPLVYQVHFTLNRLINPTLRPIRRYLPDTGGIDLAPILLILFLQFVQYTLFYYF